MGLLWDCSGIIVRSLTALCDGYVIIFELCRNSAGRKKGRGREMELYCPAQGAGSLVSAGTPLRYGRRRKWSSRWSVSIKYRPLSPFSAPPACDRSACGVPEYDLIFINDPHPAAAADWDGELNTKSCPPVGRSLFIPRPSRPVRPPRGLPKRHGYFD